MGYSMYQVDRTFHISALAKQNALVALFDWEDRKYHERESRGVTGYPPEKRLSLEAQIELYGWTLETDEQGNVVGIEFGGDRLCDEDEWLAAIAPFVDKGSYIEMNGEDGIYWKWYFDGKTCTTYYAQLVYPEIDALEAQEENEERNLMSCAEQLS